MIKSRKMSEAHKKAISLANMGHVTSEETRRKISVAHKGRVRSPEWREMQRVKMTGLTGKKARHWLGDNVGKMGIHIWLRKTYGRPKLCEHCKTTDVNKLYEWASIDHKYVRRRSRFMRLCRSCHRKYDIKHNYYRSDFFNSETARKNGRLSGKNKRLLPTPVTKETQ